ncbi:uncharacterized protein H6S33_009424 [Morchella sextelata]|uniref:uncharacterized protein n=1 Tax=Morchella sextelata TaxID=1174677 RepID=UPI001D047933|nr:uncharacterized protein H6S33_009424 [Morchella sextelata]KAH0613044.1 hypothetical protein H6S33_009424 [Morchella sextelata]
MSMILAENLKPQTRQIVRSLQLTSAPPPPHQGSCIVAAVRKVVGSSSHKYLLTL